ncbi:hypothetical protein, partial [Staphylococcus aureus]
AIDPRLSSKDKLRSVKKGVVQS